MGRRCVVWNCRNSKSYYKQPLSCPVHSFPHDLEFRGLWIQLTVPENFGHNIKNYGVCQLHFQDDDYTNESKLRLVKHALPSKLLNKAVNMLQSNNASLMHENPCVQGK